MSLTQVEFSINKVNSQHPDFNSSLQGLAIQAVISGATVRYLGGDVCYLIDPANISMPLALGVYSLGATVRNYPFFIKVVPTDVVPNGVPGADGAKTWGDWKGETFEFHTGSDSNVYVAGEAQNGESVTFNDFAAVFADCIDVATFRSLTESEVV